MFNLVPFTFHFLQLEHDGIHTVLIHLTVLHQSGTFQLKVLLLLEILWMKANISNLSDPGHKGRHAQMRLI